MTFDAKRDKIYTIYLTKTHFGDSPVICSDEKRIMEIIDAHVHLYPEKIAAKATSSICSFYNIQSEVPAGTIKRLLDDGKRNGISRFVVHSVATTAHQVRSINEFIKSEVEAHPEFIGFITLHQDLSEEDVKAEVEWAVSNHLHGIKLHPDFQKFHIDDEAAEKFYRAAGDKLPILLHLGDERFEFSRPHRLVNMAKKYPHVNFIAAHFGGYQCWDDSPLYCGLDNVYFDTCSTLPFLDVEKAKSIIDLHGAHKFFFGTDFPLWDATSELERFHKIPLTETEKEMILGGNIKRLLKL